MLVFVSCLFLIVGSGAILIEPTILNSRFALNHPAVFQVTDPVEHSEGPTWDNRNNILYYVDIHSGRTYSLNYETGRTSYVTFNGEVSPIIPSARFENRFVIGLNRTVVAFEWDGENEITRLKNLVTVSEAFSSRFNDGKADKNGRLWIGTMGLESQNGSLLPNRGIFYRITEENITVAIAPVSVSNGLAWNKANDKLYYIDTPTKKIVEYDYDADLGEITYSRVAFDFTTTSNATGFPDGMTIDEEDNLWIATYGGGSVLKVNPETGTLLQVVPLPATDVTSAMWGGPNLDILFVTTSKISLTEEQKKEQPTAGSVFAITNLGTKGLPVFGTSVADAINWDEE